MELQTFIAETLKQIADGIKEGHEYIVESKLGHGVSDRRAINVSFDLGLTVNQTEKGSLGGKIGVSHVFSGGGEKETSRTNSSENRIKFDLVVFVFANGDRNRPIAS